MDEEKKTNITPSTEEKKVVSAPEATPAPSVSAPTTPAVSSSPKSVESDGTSLTEKMRNNPWVVSTFILAILALILIFSGGSSGGGTTGSAITGNAVAVMDKTEATNKVLDFVNSQVDGEVTLVETTLKNGLYEIVVSYNGQQIPLYVTADGENLVQGVTPIDLLIEQANTAAPTTPTSTTPTTPEAIAVSVDDDAVKGDPNAPVTMVEFSDYECPFCGRYFNEVLPQIISAYVDTGKVKIVFRDFPLSFHPDAQKAAEAAECAGEQDAYWEMHDMLYSNQQALDVDSLKGYASELGLNTADFNDCLDSGAMAAEVAADIAEGKSYGVEGTPASFINGVLIGGAYPFEEFQRVIEEELAKVA